MREDIKKYSENPTYSCLLVGSRGLGMDDDALKLASSILDCKPNQLKLHPDFMSVDSGKEKSIGVEVIEEVLLKAALVPSIADKIVIVIKEFNKVTEQAQNKLLKLIEESKHVLIIGTVYQNNILDTIKSRCIVFQYKPYSETEFEEYCKEHQLADPTLLYYLTNGCPRLCEEDKEALEVFKSISQIIASGEYRSLLSVLHLQEEKDRNNFYNCYPDLVTNLFRFMNKLFLQKFIESKENNYIEVCAICADNSARCTSSSYTSENFFYAMAQIITRLEEKKNGSYKN